MRILLFYTIDAQLDVVQRIYLTLKGSFIESSCEIHFSRKCISWIDENFFQLFLIVLSL
jgi:hypothetical protein